MANNTLVTAGAVEEPPASESLSSRRVDDHDGRVCPAGGHHGDGRCPLVAGRSFQNDNAENVPQP